jgi:hypothetical protein
MPTLRASYMHLNVVARNIKSGSLRVPTAALSVGSRSCTTEIRASRRESKLIHIIVLRLQRWAGYVSLTIKSAKEREPDVGRWHPDPSRYFGCAN